MGNLTFGELIALIFFVPITLAIAYTVVAMMWFYVSAQFKAKRILAIIRRENRSDKPVRDRN